MKTQARNTSLLLILIAIFCFPIEIGADFKAAKAIGDKTYMEALIVHSIGIGYIEAEAFGLDLLRLKKDNIRIHFDDVSTIPDFLAMTGES